jgi:tRNA (guanine10-N2)-dimethyltransferase
MKTKSNKKFNPIIYNKGNLKLYLYTINFIADEESLCKMEMKCLFKKVTKAKYFFSYHYVDPSRSPFIKQCILVMYTGNSMEDIISKLVADNLLYEKYKVCYFDQGNETIGFRAKRSIEYSIGFNILGEAEMDHPEVLLGVVNLNGKWILGEAEINNSTWKTHIKKPYSYSNALSTRVSRALVNIAVCDNLKATVVDPCCGIGTVVIEALSMGIDIKGYEINQLIAENAKINLDFFGYKNIITTGDMHCINDIFDVAIVDLPYGLFSSSTLKEQVDIMKTSRKIAKNMVIITFENMDHHIISSGFNIIARCHVSKGRFKRYITICN